MKRFAAALCAALLLAGCAASGPTREAREHYENGQRAYKAENNKVAESEFAAALAEYPDYAEAALQLGYARYRLKKYDAARESLERAMKLYGPAKEGVEAEFWIGLCEYGAGYELEGKGERKSATGRYQRAEATLSSVIKKGYTANDVFAHRAWTRVALEMYGKAQSDFRRAIKYTSDSAKKKEWQDAVDNINRIYGEMAMQSAERERQESVDKAKEDAAKLTTADAAFAKAKEQFEREQFGACRVYCERALELDAGHEEARKMLKKAEEYDWK